MRLREYILKLQEMLEKEGDLELIYSSDDEGNYFYYVNNFPSIQYYNEEDFDIYYFTDEDNILQYSDKKVICLN